jgi:restriction endonuclease
VGSLKFDGIRFVIYPNDHLPRHVHGFYGETETIVDLRRNDTVALAERKDAIRPANAKKSDVKKILNAAAQHFEELTALWEGIHGQA